MALGFTGGFKWFGAAAQRHIDGKIHAGLMAAGQKTVGYARSYIHNRTGALSASVGFIYRQSDKTLTLHADAPYAWFVEFGTRFMIPHPFLRPALLKASPWWANTALQFQQIRSPGTTPMPRANAHAIARGNLMNRVIDSKFSGRKAPALVVHGPSARSTPQLVSKFGAGGNRVRNVGWKRILGK
jgi:HK97 gp10 family phage protein